MIMSGASSLALEHYRAIGVKQVQNDTLSHFVLSRASTFSLAATGDLTYSSECIESSQIYMVNSQDVSSSFATDDLCVDSTFSDIRIYHRSFHARKVLSGRTPNFPRKTKGPHHLALDTGLHQLRRPTGQLTCPRRRQDRTCSHEDRT